jgi:uncharacterized protein (DUF302 family)
LQTAISAGGATLFARIDQQAAAEGVGLSLRPTTLFIFGNPRGGTPLMHAYPLSALDLPLKVLVWEEHDQVSVAYTRASDIGARYGMTGLDDVLANVQRLLDAVVAAVGDRR